MEELDHEVKQIFMWERNRSLAAHPNCTYHKIFVASQNRRTFISLETEGPSLLLEANTSYRAAMKFMKP